MDVFLSLLKAFLIGGLFCSIGQVLLDYTKLTPARILVTFVISGVVLGGFGIYQPIIDFAGAGATVPLTGFGNLLAEGVKKSVDSDGIIGIFTGGLTAAAAGISAAIFFGFLMAIVFKPGKKD